MPDLDGLLRLVRPEDLLVLDIEVENLQLSDDGRRLERVDAALPAGLAVRLPSQHVAERAFFEFEDGLEPADSPPVGALAAAPSRLSFALRDNQASVAFSIDGLLNWETLVPRLAPNALPPDVSDGPAPGVPAADQTAIEFPYRLLLSPDASARWTHRREPFTVDGRTELWHTRLARSVSPVPVRAVGRRPVPDTLRTSLSDRDLDEIVTLTSDFSVRPKSWHELGLSFPIWFAWMQAAGLFGFDYVPRPLEVEHLMLTPLGASVRSRGHWDYPGERDREALESFGMPTPSLERYEHIAGLGRDQLVRVVRRGYLHTGQRASIVKVTERRFEPRQLRTEEGPQGPVGVFGATAYLRQYYKIVVQEPEISYRALSGGYEHGGREMPLQSLRLTTLETPKIGPGSFTEPFWITVGGREYEFGFVATDWEDQTITGSIPLVFVPDEAAKNAPAVVKAFESADERLRRRSLANQDLALADPTESKRGSTRAPTEALTFTLKEVRADRVANLPITYRPRWLMEVGAADVHLESVERLTGSANAVRITFDQAYLGGGLAPEANAAGVFARLAEQVDVKFGGAQAGGLARPDASVQAISSRQGALASSFAQPAGSQPDVATVFGNSKLFGTFALKDVLAEIGELKPDHFTHADLPEDDLQKLLDDPDRHLEIPVLRTRPLERDGRRHAVETRYVWKPRLAAKAPFEFDGRSELVLDARTVTPLDGKQATSEVRGELRGFSMSFLGVVAVRMDRLAFGVLPGRKPDVTAEGLDLEFKGALQFVNTLREALSTDGFSDPPAIELTPEGIRTGYSLGIPTVGVGVFSLQNLALSAALSVPFIEKPAGVRFGLSERHHPFLVTVTLFGGGGFFALGVSAKGVDEIEAAIEFGGNISLNLGVASGGVYVMAGIYFGRTGKVATLTGYLRCGGYLSVLGLIAISIEFYLAFTYRDKGGGRSEVWGQARVTVCVAVACFNKTVVLTLERRFAGAGGDPALEEVLDPEDWETYCTAFALDQAA
jgi:hypothetical protein